MPSSPGAEELREQITHLWHGPKRGYPTRTCHSVIVGIDMLDAFFRERLENFDRIKLVPIPPDTQQQIAAGPEISGCNGCERDYAKSVGANWAAWGTVQKVSNLILNINVYIEDATRAKLEFFKSVDIRGNTDESWRHGLDYLLRHYLFDES